MEFVMPQLDFSAYASQAFWIISCFCFLWLMIAIFVTPKIADILEQRKRKINEYIQKAEELNFKAQKSLEKYETALASAKHKAQVDMAQNQKEISLYLANSSGELNKKLSKKIADSEFSLAKEKKETLQQIDDIAQNIAFDIVQKL